LVFDVKRNPYYIKYARTNLQFLFLFVIITIYNQSVTVSKDLKDIDKQIELIQKSTRVTFKSKTLAWLHNDLRRIFKFYYKWHLKPYSGKVHIGVLIIYTLSIIFGAFNFCL